MRYDAIGKSWFLQSSHEKYSVVLEDKAFYVPRGSRPQLLSVIIFTRPEQQTTNSTSFPSTTAQQGHRDGRTVQSQFKDLVPMAHRTDLDPDALLMERPSEDEVALTAGRTKAALEKLVSGKIKAAQPKHVPDVQG